MRDAWGPYWQPKLSKWQKMGCGSLSSYEINWRMLGDSAFSSAGFSTPTFLVSVTELLLF
jgi:hypothetical protein